MQDQPSMRQACCFKQTIRIAFIHCLPLLENTLILVPKGFGSLFKSITDNYKFENILLNGAELEASLAPKLMIYLCNFFCKLRTAFALIKATTECRATFKHSPNEPARLARQWVKERGIIVRALSVHIFSGSFGSAVDTFLSRAEFIYLAARLARQWMKERGIIVCTLIVGFIYVTSHAKTFLYGIRSNGWTHR